MKKIREKYRIAIYIRVSTEEQAENPEGSIKNQEQRLREYVRLKNSDAPFGEIAEVFCDPGISAKDMKRPALQKMLTKIRSGEVNLVLVTEISRLSRSMRDFTLLWDFLKEHGCEFQSLRDNFDTTTPAGEMILFTLANFAQFERKQLGERISQAFLARAKRGLWNGGVIPLGYELNPDKPGHLRVVPKEAEIVKDAFETFLREETLARTGKALNDKGVRLPQKLRGGGGLRMDQFNIDSLHRMLTNRAYIAKRVFQTKDGPQEVDALWEAIIDTARFNRVQQMLKSNKWRKKPPSPRRYPYLLSGLLVCKACGDRLCGKSARGNGGKIGYYEHTWSTKAQSCLSKKVLSCEPHRILAKRIEPVVWADVLRLLTHSDYARMIFEEAKANSDKFSLRAEKEKIQAKIVAIGHQIKLTTERVSELPKEIDAQVFFDQILKLQKTKTDYEGKLQEMGTQQSHFDSALNIKDFEKFTADLRALAKNTTDPNVQAAICRKLIQKIAVSPAGIAIHYHVGEQHFRGEFDTASAVKVNKADIEASVRGSAGKPAGPQLLSKRPSRKLEKYRYPGAAPLGRHVGLGSSFHFDDGSNTLTSGRASCPISEHPQSLDFIGFEVKHADRIIAARARDVNKLYLSGLSLREIAERLKLSKNKTRSILIRAGITLRADENNSTTQRALTLGRGKTPLYFGFCYFEGRVTKCPREFPTLLMIHERWRKKLSIQSIANDLNKLKRPTRHGKRWSYAAIKKIVQRFETQILVIQKGGKYEFR
jgi:site-specific DNA recombinase